MSSQASVSSKRFALFGFVAVAIGVASVGLADAGRQVNQQRRGIPLVEEVDVVLIGGGTGAVAAAVEAASHGAEVYLVAPYPYLGDDMTATLRLWLEDGETPADPLARAIFEDPQRKEMVSSRRLTFDYEASLQANPKHRDSTPGGKLTDGICASASSDSVQFDGDVTLVADLGASTEFARVALLAFQRTGASDPGNNFKVQDVQFLTSVDGQSWRLLDTAGPSHTDVVNDGVVRFEVDRRATARYVKLQVRKAAKVQRVLLGEIVIVPPVDTTDKKETARLAPRPMHVKRALDNALLDAGVKYIYSTYVTDLVRDQQGQPCGVITVNRAGRQAILAKVIVDATPRADIVGMAGARTRPFPSGPQRLQYVVIGGQPQPIPGGSYEILGQFEGRDVAGRFPIINYTLPIDMADASWASWCRAEQSARDATYHEGQQFTADALFQVPPDPIFGKTTSVEPELNVEALPVSAFQPRDLPNVIVLGARADISRQAAAQLMRPLARITAGRCVGRSAADLAASRAEVQPAKSTVGGPKPTASPAASGQIGEVLIGMRPVQELPTIVDQARAIPVLGQYDVVVVGAGTCGAPAGISASRAGAKTLVLEYLHTLGGVGTTGAISSYYWGNRVGFTASVPGEGRWVIEQKMNFWRSELLKAGGELWCGTLGCGALVDGNTVRGVVVATPQGRGVVLADVVIDTTGNSDIAFAAGAETMYTDEKELAVQGTGLPPRQLGASYANTDFTIVDETDAVDVWHVFIYSKDKFATVFDQGKLLDTRERRRIVGDFVMNLLDQINHRTYPDTVAVAYSNFDTHGYTVDPYVELQHPEKIGHYVSVPFRCTLPRDLEGILVGGLGISCHRDAIPLVRMQADMQNLGYALGHAASMACAQGIPPRQIDIRALQRHLIEMKNIPATVLSDADSHVVTDQQLAEAVRTLPHEFDGVQLVMWAPREKAHQAVRAAYLEATQLDARRAYAQVLAVMGDPIGVELIIQQVQSFEQWDLGWDYKGMGQFGSALSQQDRLIVALGRAGDPVAIPTIVQRLKMLSAKAAFSHHRACALALELLGDESAARPLYEHLSQDGMTGYVHDTLQRARKFDAESPGGRNAEKTRRDSLRELVTARALFRCGDYQDLGRAILESYISDLRGHFSRHAKAVLDETP